VASDRTPYILMSLYQSLYKEKYGKDANINKFREKWAMQDVIDSVGLDRAKDLMVYYFSLQKNGHPLQFFFYNFDRMNSTLIEIEKDKERRRLLLEETKSLVKRGGIE
jgi:hypothetical protein